jgi:hypothetical protein
VPTSSIVNELRYGWATDLEGDDPNPALIGAGLGLLDVSVVGVQLGPINYLPRVEPNERRQQVAHNLSWSKGNHMIKAGVDITCNYDYALFLLNPHGSAKNWQEFSQTLGTGTTRMDERVRHVCARPVARNPQIDRHRRLAL